MNELKCLTDQNLNKWCKNGVVAEDVIIIDVREPSEYEREHIAGSRNIPVSKLRSTDFSADKHKVAIFHCRSGHRTKLAKDIILGLGFKDTYCMSGGIGQWKKCDLPVVCNTNGPIDIMRQVQITAGSLVVLGVILGWLISPYFFLLSAFVGAGLIFAGISGTCGMAVLLAFMPWNT